MESTSVKYMPPLLHSAATYFSGTLSPAPPSTFVASAEPLHQSIGDQIKIYDHHLPDARDGPALHGGCSPGHGDFQLRSCGNAPST